MSVHENTPFDINKCLKNVCYNGITDRDAATIFYYAHDNKRKYIYDPAHPLKSQWYYLTEFGTYKVDAQKAQLIKDVNTTLWPLIKKHYKDEITMANERDKETLKKMNVNNCNWFASCNNKVVGFLKLRYYENDPTSMFNKNKSLIAFDNGVFNVDTRKFKTNWPEEYINITTGYSYNKQLSTPETKRTIMNTLEQIIPDTEELDYLLTSLSSCLKGGKRFDQYYIWIGPDNCGKTQLMDLLSECLGNKTYYHRMSVPNFSKNLYNNVNDYANVEHANKLYCRCLFDGLVKNVSKRTIKDLEYITICDITKDKPLFLFMDEIPKVDIGNKTFFEKYTFIDFPNKFVENPANADERAIDLELNSKIKSDEWRVTFFHILLEYHRKQTYQMLPPRLDQIRKDLLLECHKKQTYQILPPRLAQIHKGFSQKAVKN